MLKQLRMGIIGGKGEILRATLGVKTVCHRNGLKQGGFAGTVFAHKKGYIGVECEPSRF